MATYNELTLESYYLIREKDIKEIALVQPVMETGKCVLLLYIDEVETTMWKKKEDKLDEIIEELTEEQVAEYENLFDGEEDAWGDWDVEETEEYSEDFLDEDAEDEKDEEEEDEKNKKQ